MAVGLAWGGRTTGNPIRQHAHLCTVVQKLSGDNKELPGKTRPPWTGGGRHKNRGYNFSPAQLGPEQRNGQKGSQKHIRTTPSVKCGLFWAELGRHETQLHGIMLAWERVSEHGGSWRSLTGDRWNEDGDKGHDEDPEEPKSGSWAKPNSNLMVCYTYMNHKRI